MVRTKQTSRTRVVIRPQVPEENQSHNMVRSQNQLVIGPQVKEEENRRDRKRSKSGKSNKRDNNYYDISNECMSINSDEISHRFSSHDKKRFKNRTELLQNKQALEIEEKSERKAIISTHNATIKEFRRIYDEKVKKLKTEFENHCQDAEKVVESKLEEVNNKRAEDIKSISIEADKIAKELKIHCCNRCKGDFFLFNVESLVDAEFGDRCSPCTVYVNCKFCDKNDCNRDEVDICGRCDEKGCDKCVSYGCDDCCDETDREEFPYRRLCKTCRDFLIKQECGKHLCDICDSSHAEYCSCQECDD